jgi:hypothetical protein
MNLKKRMPWYKDVRFNKDHYERENCVTNDEINHTTPSFICYETDSAFAHWVYEDFIYICHPDGLPDSINSLWNNINVHAVWPKEYKTPFLESIGIPKNRQVSGELPTSNFCWFPENQLLLNQNISINEDWLDRFEKWIQQQKTSKHLFHFLILPRQFKESYHANDRRVHIEPMIEYVKEEMKKQNLDLEKELVIYHTDKMTNIKEQIQIVGSAINIILDAASSYFVNGMFAENATIFSIGPWRHHEQFAIMGQIHARISSRNIVHWVAPLRVDPGHDYHDASKISKFYSVENNNDWRESNTIHKISIASVHGSNIQPNNIRGDPNGNKSIPLVSQIEKYNIQSTNVHLESNLQILVIIFLLVTLLIIVYFVLCIYSKIKFIRNHTNIKHLPNLV